MSRRLLALAAMAGLAAATAPGPEVVPGPRPPAQEYEPGRFRWRNVKGSYSRTLAERLRKPHKTRSGSNV